MRHSTKWSLELNKWRLGKSDTKSVQHCCTGWSTSTWPPSSLSFAVQVKEREKEKKKARERDMCKFVHVFQSMSRQKKSANFPDLCMNGCRILTRPSDDIYPGKGHQLPSTKRPRAWCSWCCRSGLFFFQSLDPNPFLKFASGSDFQKVWIWIRFFKFQPGSGFQNV